MNYNQLRHICRDYSLQTKKIRAALNTPPDQGKEEVEEAWKFQKKSLREIYKRFLVQLRATKDLYWYGQRLKEEIDLLEKTKKKLYNEIQRRAEAKARRGEEAYFTPEDERRVRTEVKRKQKGLVVKQKKVNKAEQELIIKQEELEIAIKDTNLAKSSYYHLSEAEIDLFENQRPKILKGVEKYGTISLAKKNDATITMRTSSIMHYASKHPQFRADLEIAKQVFKDNLDAEIMDRALNGTKNPVFQKGEYIGDYAVKDNKLLVEVAKAKLPETYNPRAYAAANPQSAGGTTINIVSFDGVDETKYGYAKNIGVVKAVDDSGRVQRITQAKKMLEHYEKKGTAEINDAGTGIAEMPKDMVIDAEVIKHPDVLEDE